MSPGSKGARRYGWLFFFLGLLLSAGVPQGVEAAIVAALEGPEDGQQVSAGWSGAKSRNRCFPQIPLRFIWATSLSASVLA